MELEPPPPPPPPPPPGSSVSSVSSVSSASSVSSVPVGIVRVRASVRRSSAEHAVLLREVAGLVGEGLDVPVAFRRSSGDRDVDGLVFDLVATELSVGLGISGAAAASMVSLAWRLHRVLPNVLTALSSGLLDPARAMVLSRCTEVLDDEKARAVAGRLLAQVDVPGDPDGEDGKAAGAGPWDWPSPRAWKQRVDRAVVRADTTAAERRRQAAVAGRRVQAWAEDDGIGVLQVRTDAADIAVVDRVLNDLARSRPRADADGLAVTWDQRRADAFTDLFRRVLTTCLATGTAADEDLPQVRVHRSTDLGLVLHADTLFGEGPAATDCAELRGLGAPTAVDPASGRSLARDQLRRGTPVQVMVVDATGALAHVIRLTKDTAKTCRDRKSLLAAVRAALPRQPELATGSYVPTAAITRFVHAAAPTCSFYDCPRLARRSDLDHDTPYPRGPTSVTNLDPKCHRHHDHKTMKLVRTRLNAGPRRGPRSVTWTLRNGLRVTTTPEPLPGCGVVAPGSRRRC